MRTNKACAKAQFPEACKPARDDFPYPKPMPVGLQAFEMFVAGSCTPPSLFATSKERACVPQASSGCTNSKENTMMNMDTETRQRNQLQERASEVHCQTHDNLRRDFHVDDDAYPNEAEDFVQRIKDGKYVLRARIDCWCGDNSFLSRVRWRDPNVQADTEGFKAAEKRLVAAYENLRDQISFAPFAEAYAAFEAFKTASFATA